MTFYCFFFVYSEICVFTDLREGLSAEPFSFIGEEGHRKSFVEGVKGNLAGANDCGSFDKQNMRHIFLNLTPSQIFENI